MPEAYEQARSGREAALCDRFVPLVVREACADRDPRPHESALFDLQAKYAEVIDEPTALRVLTA